MKKLLCLLLTITLITSLAACGTKASTTPLDNEPDNSFSMEAVATDSTSSIAENASDATDAANTDPQIVTYTSVEEYENKIHELGFTEFTVQNPLFEEVVLFPTNLTFTDDSFKLEFVYKNYSFETEESVEETWILYGTKNTEPAHISEYQGEGYSTTYINDFATIPGYDASFLHEVEYLTGKVIDDTIYSVMTMAYYFKTTYNLYNLTTITSDTEIVTNYPLVFNLAQ